MSAESGETCGGAGLKRCVLLAEDDEINQEIVRALVADIEGVELTVTSDGREALEAAMLRKFDLLLIDRKMPFIPGDRLIRHLRASPNPNSSTFAILFSASTEGELKDLIGSNPADEVMTKPIKPRAFQERLRAILKVPQDQAV